LFAGVGAARTFDYFSTLNLRRRGDQEILVPTIWWTIMRLLQWSRQWEPVFRLGRRIYSIATAITNWNAGTSLVHFGLATTGAVRNYCLKTAHPRTNSLAARARSHAETLPRSARLNQKDEILRIEWRCCILAARASLGRKRTESGVEK